MKVILRADVENLGRLGDLVEVKPGYGRNYLLPHGLAMLATPSNLKVFELERKKLQVLVEGQRQDAASLADKLNAAHVVISMRVGENDKLYVMCAVTMDYRGNYSDMWISDPFSFSFNNGTLPVEELLEKLGYTSATQSASRSSIDLRLKK